MTNMGLKWMRTGFSDTELFQIIGCFCFLSQGLWRQANFIQHVNSNELIHYKINKIFLEKKKKKDILELCI